MRRQIDRKPEETFQQYAERKDSEWAEAVRAYWTDGSVSIEECVRRLADAIDANILAKYTEAKP